LSGDIMMRSIWTQSSQMPAFPALEGNHKTDVLIIGGGIAGILCAHFLTQAGVNCIVAEARQICSGITKDTTAKITAQHGLVFHKLLKTLGQERAGVYLQANLEAVKQFEILCQGIDCGYEKKSHCVYSSRESLLQQELEALARLGYHADFCGSIPLPVSCAGAVRFHSQGQFHPLQFLGSLSKSLPIFENTVIRQWKDGTAITDQARIRPEKVIVATHFPMFNKHGLYFMKLYQQRSYVLALEQTQNVDGMYIGAEKNSLSFRNYGNLLLLGGGGHRTGKGGGNWAELKSFAQVNYPGAKVVSQWATQDCMTLDGLPYIGQYAASTPGCYVATGFNKWGITNSMVSAIVLRNMILGVSTPWQEAFSPSRSMLRPQLLVNSLESAANLLRFSGKRCPHMGCALRWNPQEHSWDCPCHGSRFSGDGNLIDNPATGGLKEKAL